jgi:hypothetical protein
MSEGLQQRTRKGYCPEFTLGFIQLFAKTVICLQCSLYHNSHYFFFQAVLIATLACALAEPGLLAGGITTYTSIAGAPIAAPLAAASIAAPLAAAPIAAPLAAAPIAASLAAAPIAAPLAAAPIAAPLAAAAIAAPLATQSKYHIQDSLGQASYGHAEPLQTHNAIQVSKQLKNSPTQSSISFTSINLLQPHPML